MICTLAGIILSLLTSTLYSQGIFPTRNLRSDPEVGFGSGTSFLQPPTGPFSTFSRTNIAQERALIDRINKVRNALTNAKNEVARNQAQNQLDTLLDQLFELEESAIRQRSLRSDPIGGAGPYDSTRGLRNETAGEVAEKTLQPLPRIQVRVRVIEVDRSNVLQAQSVLEYISRSKMGKPTLTSGNTLNTAGRNLQGTTSFTNAGLVPATGGAGMLVNLTAEHINLVASLLGTEFNADLVTAPEVVTNSGQNVEFVSGSKLPFALGQNVIVGTADAQTQFFYKHVGAYISVTPTLVPKTDLISLEIVVRLSDAGSQINLEEANSLTEVNTEDNVRAIANVIQVKNKTGLVMGGLIGENEIERLQKVPVLGDVPGLGFLFRSKTTDRQKTETVVFVEARVLDSASREPTYENFELSQDYVDDELHNNPLHWAMQQAGFGSYLPPLSAFEESVWHEERLCRKILKKATALDDLVE